MLLTRRSNQVEICRHLPDWIRVPVRQMGSVVTGKALAVNAPGPMRPYLRTKNVFDGHIDVSDVLTMPMSDEEFARFEARPGDVLLNEGQSLELVGRCAMYRGEYPARCAIQNQLIRFRAKAGVSNDFACHLFRWCQRSGVFARVALQTTSIAHLGGKRFERLVLLWPPTEAEQTSIAAALSDVDELIASLDRLIAKKRAVKQAAMQQLLTGRTRLPGFSGTWSTRTLHSLAEIDSDNLGASTSPLFEFRYLSLEDVERGAIRSWSEQVFRSAPSRARRRIQDHDILFATVRPNLKSHVLVPDGFGHAVCSTGFAVIRCKPTEAAPEFVFAQLFAHGIEKQVEAVLAGSNYPAINSRDVKRLTVPAPDVEEQAAIGRVLGEMDGEISALERRRDKVKALKQGMMQALLTGRVRLPVASSNALPETEPVAQAESSKGHNWQINEAVVIGVLAKTFGSEAYPLGRKRYTKLSYLLHRHAEKRADGYLKKAAGPYNPSTKYGGPEKIALKNRYIREHVNGKFRGFVAADGIAQAEGYFEKWYGLEALKWIEQFRMRKNDALGVLATVDMAAQELRAAGREVTVPAIKAVLAADKEWKQKLSQPEFSDRNIAAAIQESARLFGASVTEARSS